MNFTDPDGNTHTTNNISEFSRRHHLCYESMLKLGKDKIKQYRGWRLGENLGVYKRQGYKVSNDDAQRIQNLANEGVSAKLIALRFGISQTTVKNYVL